MSGSWLNVSSLRNVPDLQAKYGVVAPEYPVLDLPFIAFLDVLVLGYSVPFALVYGR
jgi:uncharacterized protein YceK